MLWIKRNLFLAIGGLIALILLGVGIFFCLGAKSRSAAVQAEIDQAKAFLEQFKTVPVFPSPTNIALAKSETEKLRGVVTQMKQYFTPVKAENVTGLAFRSWRDTTLADLRDRARKARTTLPNNQYPFSFEAQKNKVDFKEGTFPSIPQQMAEVKALSMVLFDGHVDPLVNIRRARVSRDDDESPVATDYLAHKVTTNTQSGMVTSPYELTFHCLSSGLAVVMDGFIRSPHGFVVKAVHIEPVAATGGPAPGPGGVQPLPPAPGSKPPGNPPGVGALPPPRPGAVRVPGAPAAGGAAKPAAGDRSFVLLKEQRLKVTMLVHVIKAVK